MSVSEEEMKKGFFHQYASVPFWTYISGNATEYKGLNQQLESVKKNESEQLRLQSSLEQQQNQLVSQQLLLQNSLKQNNDDVAHMQMLVKEAENNLKDVEFNSPFSMKPRIPTPVDLVKKGIGLIPYFGPIFTGYQVYNYNLQRKEATNLLNIEKQALTDINEFGSNTKTSLNTTLENFSLLQKKLEANGKILKGLQQSQVDLKTKITKL
ncbi:hypothetical protein [Methylomonas sp. AM2-LC]|uniref:hypothetical protein n=1 Tax=Methylomonas sp. AM2-LC TaxID=3153301 RepID=UPI003264F37B